MAAHLLPSVWGSRGPHSHSFPHSFSVGTSSFLLPIAMPFAPNSFLLLVVGPGAPSSVLAPSSDALCSMRYVTSPSRTISPRWKSLAAKAATPHPGTSQARTPGAIWRTKMWQSENKQIRSAHQRAESSTNLHAESSLGRVWRWHMLVNNNN